MRFFGGVRRWLLAHDPRDAPAVRVTLPRLTRPNLVARLYMLFTALGTASVAWGVPSSSISRIMASGGITPHVIVGVMLAATVFGLLDIMLNDVAQLRNDLDPRGITARAVCWLEDRRVQRCYVIGGCYLVLTYAGVGSTVTGTFWLLAYWMQMTFCAGMLAWSLRALMSATLVGGRDATA